MYVCELCVLVITLVDEEGDMDIHDRGVLYYRLLKHDVREAQKVVCGQPKTVAEANTVIPRVSRTCQYSLSHVICQCTKVYYSISSKSRHSKI